MNLSACPAALAHTAQLHGARLLAYGCVLGQVADHSSLLAASHSLQGLLAGSHGQRQLGTVVPQGAHTALQAVQSDYTSRPGSYQGSYATPATHQRGRAGTCDKYVVFDVVTLHPEAIHRPLAEGCIIAAPTCKQSCARPRQLGENTKGQAPTPTFLNWHHNACAAQKKDIDRAKAGCWDYETTYRAARTF